MRPINSAYDHLANAADAKWEHVSSSSDGATIWHTYTRPDNKGGRTMVTKRERVLRTNGLVLERHYSSGRVIIYHREGTY